MNIAIVTDLPILCQNTMYLDLIQKGLSRAGIYSRVLLVEKSRIFEKIDSMTGAMRIINTSRLLSKLSDCDIIHTQFTFPIGFALALFSSMRLLNKPMLVHTHGYDVFTVPAANYGIRRSMMGRFLTAYTWKRAMRVIVVCKRAKMQLQECGVKDTKIDVLYNGVDEGLFSKKVNSEIPKELALLRSENDFIFLSIASITPVKNHQRLIKSFAELVAKCQYKIKLLIIGDNTDIDHIIPGRSGIENIKYLGRKDHSDLPSYYNVADAFILPSLSEGHPWSMLEAMSCELPIIASKVGGIPETLDQKFLVNPEDTQQLVEKLEMIVMMDGKERQNIGAMNRAKILSSFRINDHINKLIEIYESIYKQSM